MTHEAEFETEQLELPLAQLDAVVGGITKAGTGTLILSSANTYAGQTTVNQGVLL